MLFSTVIANYVNELSTSRVVSVAMTTRVIQVRVKPNARASVLEEKEDGTWLAQIKSPPVDGRANEELIALVAKHFGCRKSAVSIKAGASGRLKLVQINES